MLRSFNKLTVTHNRPSDTECIFIHLLWTQSQRSHSLQSFRFISDFWEIGGSKISKKFHIRFHFVHHHFTNWFIKELVMTLEGDTMEIMVIHFSKYCYNCGTNNHRDSFLERTQSLRRLVTLVHFDTFCYISFFLTSWHHSPLLLLTLISLGARENIYYTVWSYLENFRFLEIVSSDIGQFWYGPSCK